MTRRAKNVVYPSIIPAADAAGEISVGITSPFRHLNHSITIPVSRSLYLGAKASGKSALVPAGIGDAWLAGYYAAFAGDPALVPFYQTLLSRLRKIRFAQNYDDDSYLEMLTAFVQSIPYDTEKPASIDRAPRFPVETIVDGRGICSDKSLLLAGILSHEGYAVSLLQFFAENHLTVGIPVSDGYAYRGCGHAVIESTAISYVGDASGEFFGQTAAQTLTSRPKVFPLGHGSKRYGSAAQTARILAVRGALREKLAADGDLVRDISRKETRISAKKADLAASREDLSRKETEAAAVSADPELFSCRYAEYKKALDRHNAEVVELAKQIERYNADVGEYNRLPAAAEFIQQIGLTAPRLLNGFGI